MTSDQFGQWYDDRRDSLVRRAYPAANKKCGARLGDVEDGLAVVAMRILRPHNLRRITGQPPRMDKPDGTRGNELEAYLIGGARKEACKLAVRRIHGNEGIVESIPDPRSEPSSFDRDHLRELIARCWDGLDPADRLLLVSQECLRTRPDDVPDRTWRRWVYAAWGQLFRCFQARARTAFDSTCLLDDGVRKALAAIICRDHWDASHPGEGGATMTRERDDLIRFLTDARIEVVAPRGWVPDSAVAADAIERLEAALVDRDSLAAVVRGIPGQSEGLPGPAFELTADEFDGLMDSGLHALFERSPPRFLRLIADPLQLVLLREAVLDEMPPYWWAVVRQSQEARAVDGDPPIKLRSSVAALDQAGGADRWAVEVPADAVSWTGAGDTNRTVAFEVELRSESPGGTVILELIDPAPLPASQCRVTIRDRNLLSCGRYDGLAGGITVPLTGWDGRGELYLSCEVDRKDGEQYAFVVPLGRA